MKIKGFFQRLHVRWKLSLGYACGLALILIIYSTGVLFFLHHKLFSELDRALREDLQICEQSLELDSEGKLHWDLDEDKKESSGRWFEAHYPGGVLHFTSANVIIASSGNLEKLLPETSSPPKSVTWRKHSKFRITSKEVSVNGIPIVLRAARSEEDIREGISSLIFVMLAGLPIALGLAVLGGYTLAGRALSPIAEMASQAKKIGAKNLHERLPVSNPKDELGELATIFNSTLARLENSFESLRRFTADASHELRTPLTAIRSVGEVSLQKEQSSNVYRETIGSMLEEVNRMNRLVEGLLTLSRADGEPIQIEKEQVDLSELAKSISEHLNILAENKGQKISLELEAGCEVSGDLLLLRQAIINLFDNAIKYSPENSVIRIKTQKLKEGAALEVKDSGPGIPLAHQSKIFERFYRVDPARSRTQGGVGLGLSIARWAVEINGGRIEVESEAGKGATFRIVFPA